MENHGILARETIQLPFAVRVPIEPELGIVRDKVRTMANEIGHRIGIGFGIGTNYSYGFVRREKQEATANPAIPVQIIRTA